MSIEIEYWYHIKLYYTIYIYIYIYVKLYYIIILQYIILCPVMSSHVQLGLSSWGRNCTSLATWKYSTRAAARGFDDSLVVITSFLWSKAGVLLVPHSSSFHLISATTSYMKGPWLWMAFDSLAIGWLLQLSLWNREVTPHSSWFIDTSNQQGCTGEESHNVESCGKIIYGRSNLHWHEILLINSWGSRWAPLFPMKDMVFCHPWRHVASPRLVTGQRHWNGTAMQAHIT